MGFMIKAEEEELEEKVEFSAHFDPKANCLQLTLLLLEGLAAPRTKILPLLLFKNQGQRPKQSLEPSWDGDGDGWRWCF